ncbi:hypothetical protein EYR40_001988 [Pleurotus pulmonarius]|nr:hypothetical protein EYR40_001988 [Pleurotus pulmonarius]
MTRPIPPTFSRRESISMKESNSVRPSPADLPQLSIPSPRTLTVSARRLGTPKTPETPHSLTSPELRVVDLTKCVKTISKDAEAHGGFSDIYMGEWERVHDPEENESGSSTVITVAVKLLRVLSKQDQDGVKARKRLNREVFVWHRLDHPHIARFFGTSYHMAGRPAMVMQWYKNGSATEYLKFKNPDADRMSLVRDVARGLTYLHTLEKPIVHGDLKGNNILITDEGRAALSDFGLSQVIDDLMGPSGFTPSCSEAGPVRWQAPELLEDDDSRPKLPSDVWSFGCTAYELLTGNVPYRHRLRDFLVMQDIKAGVKPAEMGDIPNRKMASILDRCWSYSPLERLTMSEVETELDDLLSAPS